MKEYYEGDIKAIDRAMLDARQFEESYGGTHDVEIRIGDSNGEHVGTVMRLGSYGYVFVPGD